MIYLFFAYLIFAYFAMLGVCLGEIMLRVKPGRTHLVIFGLAPLSLPLYFGYWMVHVMNPDAKRLEVPPKPEKK